MLELLEKLCDNTHDTFAGCYGQKLEELVKKATSFVSQKLGEDVGKMLNEAERLRGWRNNVIHSVWPNPTDEQAFGWRPRAAITQGQSATKTVVTNTDELRAVIKDMIKLIDEIGSLTTRSQAEKARSN